MKSNTLLTTVTAIVLSLSANAAPYQFRIGDLDGLVGVNLVSDDISVSERDVSRTIKLESGTDVLKVIHKRSIDSEVLPSEVFRSLRKGVTGGLEKTDLGDEAFRVGESAVLFRTGDDCVFISGRSKSNPLAAGKVSRPLTADERTARVEPTIDLIGLAEEIVARIESERQGESEPLQIVKCEPQHQSIKVGAKTFLDVDVINLTDSDVTVLAKAAKGLNTLFEEGKVWIYPDGTVETGTYSVEVTVANDALQVARATCEIDVIESSNKIASQGQPAIEVPEGKPSALGRSDIKQLVEEARSRKLSGRELREFMDRRIKEKKKEKE